MKETSGLADLLPFLDDRPALTLLAVKASAGQVTGALVDTHGPRVVEDATVRTALDAPAFDDDQWVAVVQVRDEAWTLVYRAFKPLDAMAWNDLVDDSVDLASTLGTRAVLVGLGDLDGCGRGVVLDGDAVEPPLDGDDPSVTVIRERTVWRNGRFERFESTLRDDGAAGDSVPDDFADRLFRDRGIWAPPCWPRPRGDEAWLELAEIDPTRIERVDLLDLGTRAAYDEETLEMRRDSLADDLRGVLPAPEPADAAPQEDDASVDVASETAAAPQPTNEVDRATPIEPMPEAAAEATPDPDEPAPTNESTLRGFFARLVGRG